MRRFLLPLSLLGLLHAQDPRRTCIVGHVRPGQAPRLDGDLDDPCWAGAPAIGDLRQQEPHEGAPPTQRTVVRLLHDERNLYLAIECFDTEPRSIRATQRARDAELDPDDRVEWLLDTFGTRRNAYWFQIGAAGSLGDALITNNGARFTKAFDLIWDGRAQVTDHGWQAEVRIPFQSLGYAADQNAWGFNLRRERRANNETDVWENCKQGSDFFRVAEAGVLSGLGARDQGIGLDVRPFGVFAERRQRLTAQSWDADPDAGFDASYRLTPGLTASLTAFTDFAETEVDDRRINLTRFPLFFPEKRDFFLADSSLFDFGPSANSERFLPFFSRRMGLDQSGRQVPILFGAKIAGQHGPWQVGVLDVVTELHQGLGHPNLGVLRLQREFTGQGSLGMIATTGSPGGADENATGGFDWSQRVTDFVAGGDLRWSAYALGSQTSGPGGDGYAFGADATGQAREWRYSLGGRWVDDQFNPELGFLLRRGVKQQYGDLAWRPRPGGDLVRYWFVELQDRMDVDLGNRLADLRVEWTPLGVRLESDDTVQCNVIRRFERVDLDFAIVPGVIVPSGDYWQTRYELEGESSPGRPISLTWRLETGALYQGHSTDYEGGIQWRTGPLLILGASLSETRAHLSGGRFTTHVEEARVDLHFTPRLSWKNLVQYDNESRDLGVQSRLRWILAPGSEVFVVLGTSWVRGSDDRVRPDEQSGTIKVVHTLRF